MYNVRVYLCRSEREQNDISAWWDVFLIKTPSHYNELAQRTPKYGKIWGEIWHSLVYAEVRSEGFEVVVFRFL